MRRTKPQHLLYEDAPPRGSVLRFTSEAWAKLHYFCHHGETEIGGFGIATPDDLLVVEEFATVLQKTTAVSVSFDDAAVADFFDDQVERGRKPEQFGRIWLHTHPGDCPLPSPVDEGTFTRVFGGCDWAAMFILARGGKTYARLRFNVGPGGDLLIPVTVDYSLPLGASDHQAWSKEYGKNIQVAAVRRLAAARRLGDATRLAELADDDSMPLLLDDESVEPQGTETSVAGDDWWLDDGEDQP